MSYNSTQDFLTDLESLPDLPTDERGEWVHTVWSQWIDGVFFNDRQDPNLVVTVQRAANNEEGYDETVLEYEITVRFGPSQILSMNAQSAINLGHHLIAAGTTAMRDYAKHASFLTGSVEEVTE